MIKSMSNGFYLVNEPALLKEVIRFLQKGFSWTTQRSSDIFDRLNSQEHKIPIGAMLVNNGRIVIAILLFHQGKSVFEKKEIINLSAWYAEDTHRGIDAIKFVKKLIKVLENYIITNYTPNKAVCKILKALDFTDMRVHQSLIGISKQFPFLNIVSFWKNTQFNGTSIIPLKNTYNHKLDDLKDVSFYTVNSIIKYKFTLKILNLYVPKNEYKIDILELVKLIIKHRAVRVNVFSKSTSVGKNNLWLIKNNREEDFIFPLGSELTV